MFPPASPMGERIRAKAEMHELEREAIWRAHFRQDRRWSFPKLFPFRKPESNTRTTATVRPVNVEC